MGTLAILIQAVLTADAKAALIALASEAPEQIAALIHSPDRELAKARFEETEEASMAIPAMEAFIAGLQTTYRDAKRERVVALGREIIRLIANGHAKAEDFDTAAQRDAVFEAIRFSMDALAPEVIPILARLALEPVDHFFRGLCRVLVDLDASEVLDLQRLVGAAGRAVVNAPKHAVDRKDWSTRGSVDVLRRLDNRWVLQPRLGQILATFTNPGETIEAGAPALLALLNRNLATAAPEGDYVLRLPVPTVVKLKRVVLGS